MQFAYHEISYFFIRLLQSIDSVSLDIETQRLPPADWAEAKGRKALEKVILRHHLTLYIEVWGPSLIEGFQITNLSMS